MKCTLLLSRCMCAKADAQHTTILAQRITILSLCEHSRIFFFPLAQSLCVSVSSTMFVQCFTVGCFLNSMSFGWAYVLEYQQYQQEQPKNVCFSAFDIVCFQLDGFLHINFCVFRLFFALFVKSNRFLLPCLDFRFANERFAFFGGGRKLDRSCFNDFWLWQWWISIAMWILAAYDVFNI